MNETRPYDTVPLAVLDDRRPGSASDRQVRLHADRIETLSGQRIDQRIDLDSVKTVRVSVEPAGRGVQVVLTVSGNGRAIAASSLSHEGRGLWRNNAAAFRAFAIAVLDTLKDRTDVLFVEGSTLTARLPVCLCALAAALAALGFSGWALGPGGSAALGLGGLALALAAGWTGWVFRPRGAERFDPEAMIASLKAQAMKEFEISNEN